MMSLFKVMIIDCEGNSTPIIKSYLSDLDFEIQIVDKVFSLEWLVLELKTNRTEILFLDVRFHDFFVFDIFDEIDSELLENLQIIFVSANEEFAIKAIRYSATDFILKPIKTESMTLAISKATRNIRKQKKIASLHLDFQNGNVDYERDYIAIASMDKIDIVKKKKIICCAAEGRYTTFFSDDGKKYTSCKNLGDYEIMLGAVDFFRVHHSYIVNINHISRIIKKDGYSCELLSGMQIPIAKRRIEEFNKFLRLK